MAEPKIPKAFKEKADIAVISKLVKDNDTKGHKVKKEEMIQISRYIHESVKSNDTIISLFPDIELAIEIMISSVLSPNSLVDENLLYGIEDLPLPIEVANIVISYISKYVNKEYEIEDNLYDILKESYYTNGAYIQVVIPEASLDEIINKDIYRNLTPTIENLGFDKSIGILGSTNSNVISIENHKELSNKKIVNELVEFTDNREILRFKDISKKLVNQRALTTYTGLEESRLDIDSIFKQYLSEDDDSIEESITVKNSETTVREPIGKPLVLKVPVEAVIPVHMVGDPTEHIGYFILLNEQGVPITHEDEWAKTEEEKRLEYLKTGGIGSVKSSLNIRDLSKVVPKLSDLESIYGEIINKQIANVLNDSRYGGISEVTEVNKVYSIMLTRALRNKKTKMLFLDTSTVSYVAFEYRENGTGKSQLEKLRLLSSMRAIATMTRIMANIKNSIVDTEIDVKLDENDPDPEKTVEMVIEEVTKSRELLMPLGIENMNDLVKWSRRVGYKFNFKHDTRLPDMEVVHRDVSGERAEPDTELDDRYKKDMISALGLTPEKIDTAFSGRFATTELLNDTLMVKRVVKIQKKFEVQISEMIRTILKNDYKFREELRKLFTNNIRKITTNAKRKKSLDEKVLKNESAFIDFLTRTTINNLSVKLPRPEFKENDNLNEHFKNYKDSVEEYVGILFSDEALPPELVGELGDNLEAFKTAIINTLLRQWAIENNYLTEVLEIVNDGKSVDLNILDEYANYSEMVINVILNFLKKNERRKKKYDKLYEKIADITGGIDDEEMDTGETSDNEKNKGSDTPPNVDIPKEE